MSLDCQEERKLPCLASCVIYQRINIRIVLKYLEIWTNRDPFGRVRNAGSELRNFRAYRNKHLVKRFPHDNALLLSHKSWPPNIAGLAWVNSMCGGNSNSINAWSYSSSVGPYVIVAHELGHNFAFNHDTGTCKCLTSRGCFMGSTRSRLPGFSDCSLKSLQKVNDACLYNVPTYKVCTNKKICHCQGGFDPKNGCKSEEGEKQEGGEEEEEGGKGEGGEEEGSSGEEEYEYSGGEEFEDEEDDTNEEDNEKEVEYEDDEKGEKREGKDLEEDLEMSFAKK
ncbi:disintegrin and metalloproteinase domain-containing protein 9-like [Pocillopora damicornis]|uniref:disintegrin and metalloproteinase domain-containing protein 9-like n=1 Tax=Pocillopora damicornis TaxID=46731 RepID=UPI000F5541CB|nr:disintegrin and metalloproteinase domain-containing protein 9-like [Pocillopora damicornis]